MQEIHVALGARSYRVVVESGLIDNLREYIPVKGRKALVTTPVINELYGEKIAGAIDDYELILVPDGEEAKQWDIVEDLLGKLLDAGLDRKSTSPRYTTGFPLSSQLPSHHWDYPLCAFS